jgi:hypothetical protein
VKAWSFVAVAMDATNVDNPQIDRRCSTSSTQRVTMKTVLNNLSSHIGYEHDGRLVHTDKKTGVQMVSIYTWPSLSGAREALANAFGKIEWQKFQ